MCMQAANGQPRFALGGASSAFGQYHEAAQQQNLGGSKLYGLGPPAKAQQPALFKQGAAQQQESEESMSQQLQISSSSDGAGQTAEASAALQSLYEMARSGQQDGASSRAPSTQMHKLAERDAQPEGRPAGPCSIFCIPNRHHWGDTYCQSPSSCDCSQGGLGMGAGGEKPGLSARMQEQAAAVAAELSGKGPAEGVTEAAPLSEDAEAFAPANDSAVHPKLRQKAAGISRYAT